MLRAHRDTYLEQHQTEKTETEVRDVDNSGVVDPDKHNFGNLDPHPDLYPDPHLHLDPHLHPALNPHLIKIPIQIRILIRIKIYKLDLEPDPHQFADVKPKRTEYEPILAFFQGSKPFFEAKLGSGSGSASGSALSDA
jgi:hypothetical protein